VKGHPKLKRIPIAERFWKHVDKRGPDECWPWLAYCDATRHGHVMINGHPCHAARIAYELVNGPIPPGLFACHRCNNSPCCNPAHIYAGTPLENVHDTMMTSRYSPPPHRRGEAVNTAKLTVDHVREIRVLYAEGQSQRKLASRFGVSRSNIGMIVRHTSWAHVL
jgi:hypothetical protein